MTLLMTLSCLFLFILGPERATRLSQAVAPDPAERTCKPGNTLSLVKKETDRDHGANEKPGEAEVPGWRPA
jgi:hypothetical protein